MTPPLTSRARLLRTVAWAWLALVAAIGIALGLLGATDAVARVSSDVLTYLLPMAIAAGLGVLLAIRTRGSVEYRFWTHLAAATTLLVFAESYWTWYSVSVDPRGPSLVSPVLLLYFGAGLVFLSFVLTIGRFAKQPLTDRVRFVLDVGAGILAVYPLLYLTWTLPMFADTPTGWSAAALAAAYPLFGVLLFAAAVSTVVGWKVRRWGAWERLFVAALGLLALTLASWPMWYADTLRSGGLGFGRFASLLGVVFALLSVAMVYRLTDISDGGPLQAWPASRLGISSFSRVYPLLLVAALPVLGAIAYRIGGRGAGLPVTMAVILLAVVLAARSTMVAIEQAEDLQKSFADPATGVLNRAWLDTMLRRRLVDAQRESTTISVAAFDVADEDRFNAVIGHSAGEAALANVAAVLSDETPSPGEVFSLSSCEFVMILPGMDAAQAAVVSRKTWLRLRREALVDGRPLDIAAGIAEFPKHASDAAGLVRAAEAALRTARSSETEPVVVLGENLETHDRADAQLRARMRTLRSTIRMLAEAVDARDTHTADHSLNVSELSTALSQVMDLAEDDAQVVSLAALVHDVGLVGVHDEILLKGSTLSAQERLEMESHPVLGERILAPTRVDDVLPIVRSHHERWDGSGYPDGLTGEDIPLGARILAVCDAYEAMTSGRSYQPAIEPEAALAEIEKMSGSQFDPRVAATFVRMVTQLEAVRGSRLIGLGQAGLDAAT